MRPRWLLKFGMNSILSKLFGSSDKVKIIRLFLLNAEDVFMPAEVSKRTKTKPTSTRRELNLLLSLGFVCKKKKTIELEAKNKNGTNKKKMIEGWALDSSFPLLLPLRELVLDTTPLSRVNFLRRLNKAGRMKLVVLSGIFIQNDDSRVDILVVGDKIKKSFLEKILKEVEAEVGKDLVYAVFETSDFIYRLNICDKFVRDILDYPHQKILDKLNI